MPRFIAIGDKVILHPIMDQGISPGGIIIPDSARQKEDQGVIVSKGPAVSDDLEIGDHVCFSGWAGTKISDNEGGVFIDIREAHISAKIGKKSVRLMDSATTIRLVKEVISEFSMMQKEVEFSVGDNWFLTIKSLQEKIIDRLNDLTQSEGFEW